MRLSQGNELGETARLPSSAILYSALVLGFAHVVRFLRFDFLMFDRGGIVDMKSTLITVGVVVVMLAASLWLLAWWFAYDPAPGLAVSGPLMDDPLGHRARDEARRAARIIDFGSIFQKTGDPVDGAGHWPRFRGPDLNNISPESIPLADTFPDSGPPRLWSLDVAPGYAGAAVFKGRIYLMDYTDAAPQPGDILRCLSLEDGREFWRSGYGIHIANNHGVTRTTPAVTERYTVTLGPMGHVMCVDTDSGRVRWGIDLIKTYGTRNLSKCWYAGQCPLIDNGLAIIAPVGTNVLMMGVSCETGEVLWQAPTPPRWRMSHASITPMTVDGLKTYVYASVNGVAGVAADGPGAGRLLWMTEDWGSSVVMPSPVVLDDNRLFVTSGYDGGCAVFKLHREGDGVRCETLYTFAGPERAPSCFSSYQQTPVYAFGHLFGIQSNNAKQFKMEFVCADPGEPGCRMVWNSGPDTIFTSKKKEEAWGPYVLADGKFYVVGDTGLLVLFRATTERCEKLGQWQLMDGHEVWGPLALTQGRLLIRDMTRLMCFDIRKQ
jgi:outer membrane protein assembly factor BamB